MANASVVPGGREFRPRTGSVENGGKKVIPRRTTAERDEKTLVSSSGCRAAPLRRPDDETWKRRW